MIIKRVEVTPTATWFDVAGKVYGVYLNASDSVNSWTALFKKQADAEGFVAINRFFKEI